MNNRFLSLIYPLIEKRLFFSLFLTFFLIILASLCSVSIPIFLKKIIDVLSINPQFTLIFWLFSTYALLTILERLFNEAQFITYAKWENGIIKNAFDKVFDSLFYNKPQFFIDNLHGAISAKIYQSILGLDLLMFDCVFKITPAIIGFIFIISSITFIFDFKMTLIVVLGSVVYSYVVYKFNGTLIAQQNDIRNNYIHSQGTATDLIHSWKDIKLTNGYTFVNEILKRGTKNRIDKFNVFYKKRSIYGFIQSLPICAVFIASNYHVISNYIAGMATLGSILLVNNYLFQILRPLESSSIIFRSVTKNYSDFIAIDDILNFEKEFISHLPNKEVVQLLDVKNLNVPGILNNINFSLKIGEKIAITGHSGSGKSTFLNTISGLNTNYSGDIFINGKNIKEIPINTLRNSIGHLTSDARLLNETVENNVLIGNNGDLQFGLQFSCINDKISTLKDGIKTLVSEETPLLSAGENQRLKIARTLLLNRNIELYDESTSALNHELEEKIIDNIVSQKNKAIIFVTHKKNYLSKFDKTYKIENGSLIDYSGEYEGNAV